MFWKVLYRLGLLHLVAYAICMSTMMSCSLCVPIVHSYITSAILTQEVLQSLESFSSYRLFQPSMMDQLPWTKSMKQRKHLLKRMLLGHLGCNLLLLIEDLIPKDNVLHFLLIPARGYTLLSIKICTFLVNMAIAMPCAQHLTLELNSNVCYPSGCWRFTNQTIECGIIEGVHWKRLSFSWLLIGLFGLRPWRIRRPWERNVIRGFSVIPICFCYLLFLVWCVFVVVDFSSFIILWWIDSGFVWFIVN